jgi:hypothetical protein
MVSLKPKIIRLRYRNVIEFNCSNFEVERYERPENCYNCVLRKGNPQNLGGDNLCENFKEVGSGQ